MEIGENQLILAAVQLGYRFGRRCGGVHMITTGPEHCLKGQPRGGIVIRQQDACQGCVAFPA